MPNKKSKVQQSSESGNAAKPLVIGSVLRPKNGHELLQALKENKKCEIVDTHAFIAAKALEDNQCGFCFSFKLSKWNRGWTGFERS